MARTTKGRSCAILHFRQKRESGPGLPIVLVPTAIGRVLAHTSLGTAIVAASTRRSFFAQRFTRRDHATAFPALRLVAGASTDIAAVEGFLKGMPETEPEEAPVAGGSRSAPGGPRDADARIGTGASWGHL